MKENKPASAIAEFGGQIGKWGVPEADLNRQAIPAIRGYVYQIHMSASAWINLPEDGILYLEVAEDYLEILKGPEKLDEVLNATQVKDTRESGSVTLNSKDVIDAIESLFRLRQKNEGKRVRLTFLTTSEIGQEKKNPISRRMRGIDAWVRAASGEDVAPIRKALTKRVKDKDFRAFLKASSDDELRDSIIKAMVFVCGSPDWKAVEQDNRSELALRRSEVNSTPEAAAMAYEAIFYRLIKTILDTGDRRLTRGDFLECFGSATSIHIPSQAYVDQLSNLSVVAQERSALVEEEKLWSVAEKLLVANAPLLISVGTGDAEGMAANVLVKMREERRFVVSKGLHESGDNEKHAIEELGSHKSFKHLFLGAPGSGKTYCLWNAAHHALKERRSIPIYLRTGFRDTWKDVIASISDIDSSLDAEMVIRDSRVCIYIDGWSEFGTKKAALEKFTAMEMLSGARVVANGRSASIDDGAFQLWNLEGLSDLVVSEAESLAGDGKKSDASFRELMKLPLFLALYVAYHDKAASTGGLLRRYHERIARHAPDGFTEALSGAVVEVTLSGPARSYRKLLNALKRRCESRSIANFEVHLERLGTIVDRDGKAFPVHDLYWSWLYGCGLLIEDRVAAALDDLHSRESINLALTSEEDHEGLNTEILVDDDLELAASFAVTTGANGRKDTVRNKISEALQHQSLVVRFRGSLAALRTRHSGYFPLVVDVLYDLLKEKKYQKTLLESLTGEYLYENRRALLSRLKEEGAGVILDRIASKGGKEWTAWCHQAHLDNLIPSIDALCVALSCDTVVPPWGAMYLDELIAKKPWKLRAVADRRKNRDLAAWIAKNYDRLVNNVIAPNSSAWLDLNSVVIKCGGQSEYETLLELFAELSNRSQEYLGFVVADLDESWVAKFQEKAFSVAGKNHHHKISSVTCKSIDDATAHQWISKGYYVQGWRVLIAKHGVDVLDELIAGLPTSFDEVSSVPELEMMQHFEVLPMKAVDEIWRRLKGTLRPKVTQDTIFATARAGDHGINSLVNLITGSPGAMPAYFVSLVLDAYRKWQASTGKRVVVNVGGAYVPFERWAVTVKVLASNENIDVIARMASNSPEVVTELVIGPLRNDKGKVHSMLAHIRKMSEFNEEILGIMLSSEELAKRIPEVFQDAFPKFPGRALMDVIESSYIDRGALLFRLSGTSNPLHFNAHAKLIDQCLETPFDIHHIRYVADILRSHSRSDTLLLLKGAKHFQTEGWLWLARELEQLRMERLIKEDGTLREVG